MESNGATARVAGCLVTGNGIGLDGSGGIIETTGNTLVRGNGVDVVGTVTTIPSK
jgi:hypothetical protein